MLYANSKRFTIHKGFYFIFSSWWTNQYNMVFNICFKSKLFIHLILLHRHRKLFWGYASWVECVNALSLFKFHMKCQSNGPDLRHLDAFNTFQNRIWNIVATTKKLHKNWTSNIKMIRYYVGSKYYICQGTREIPTTFFSIFNFNFSDEWSFGCNQSYTYIKRSNSS